MTASVPPVVDAAWVHALEPDRADRLVFADVRWYLDGRDGHAAYRGGHLPEAVWVDVDTALSAEPTPGGGRHPLPTPAAFAEALGALGIPDDAIVVGYDDAGSSHAARLVWLLRAIGHDAAVLDGGLAGWDGPLDTDDAHRAPVQRTVVEWPADRFATADEVGAAAASDDRVVLDARAHDRYTGAANAAVDARHGHVPGAVSSPWATNLDVDGRFLPAEDLRAAFAARGVTDDVPVTAYCGSGVTACHDLLALERAGITGARLYPGSWSAWGADLTRPVASGPNPN